MRTSCTSPVRNGTQFPFPFSTSRFVLLSTAPHTPPAPTVRRYTAISEHAGSADGAAKRTRSFPLPAASSNGAAGATGAACMMSACAPSLGRGEIREHRAKRSRDLLEGRRQEFGND